MMIPDREITIFDKSVGRAVPDLLRILWIWKGSYDFSKLKGMRVLDLAAGAVRPVINEIDEMLKDDFQPFFSRLCAIEGADVTAIDINPPYPLDKELFTCVETDLVDVVLRWELQSLPILRGKEFDLIYSKNFVGRNYCPELQYQLADRKRGLTVPVFEKVLFIQAGELLTEGGLMTLDEIDQESPRYTRIGKDIIPLLQEGDLPT